jgi:hypothetical protein
MLLQGSSYIRVPVTCIPAEPTAPSTLVLAVHLLGALRDAVLMPAAVRLGGPRHVCEYGDGPRTAVVGVGPWGDGLGVDGEDWILDDVEDRPWTVVTGVRPRGDGVGVDGEDRSVEDWGDGVSEDGGCEQQSCCGDWEMHVG